MNSQKNLNQLHQRQRILQTLLFSLITIVVWVAFELFRSQQRTTISEDLKKAAQSLNPSLDETVISQLEQKNYYSTADLANFPIYKLVVGSDGRSETMVTIDVGDDVYTKPSPSPLPTLAPNPTPEETVAPETGLEETPVATDSGTAGQ